MNMDGMTMASASMAMSPTGTGMAMPSSTGAAAGGMGGMSMGGSCKISMLWNWYTVDSCFIARSWRIKSQGAFAGSCIGVILLVIVLEALRRAGKEYDRYIVNQHIKTLSPASSSASSANGSKNPATADTTPLVAVPRFRPSVLQQAIRALLHMLQFAVAYFVMLLAMYYNGYIIICIFIGAYIGYFIFGYESFGVGQGGSDRMQENATVCCG
ncbi:copper transporter [Parastagonospora nodorum]|uniref:Copper transport protein n=2 Tax=Phaeosphaeria nodorum (strain SN15 / ATCC MYA-4574 / FGSC 10173) TaxID=321614 RepID=A0A7U2EY08_PHANO|nr:hypothetical protein SNOG_02909 [Parastagonospora nodorum SN15]KAH3919698.1 copper transporter [Parastagonospora nodorum]EAT89640.2 hypothetical protein SNOG_02909 [Parastagonospora nodorum SN15]KAH3937128.1 copper transporter [Parastagonospora nodorum]KAH3953720.1 copper transporter [Parastagonospora nodorum]KAH3962647.1 copper transporter [Parastagonospora nodorum]